MKVMVSDQIHGAGIELLKKEAEVEVAIGLDKEELIDRIKDKDALVVRSATKVTRDVLEAAEKLKVIGRAGVGVDNIDVKYATEKGVIIVNAPTASSITVAELTMGFMISMARNIPQGNASIKAEKWEKKKFLGIELRGKTLGIIGMGRIGSQVVKKAKAFEMNCIAYDPYISKSIAREIGVEIAESIDEIYKNSNFITLHVPMTEHTKHLINKDAFDKMREGVYLINAARGGIIDEKALYEALKSGKVAGAALDVFEKEPPFGNSLLEIDNFIGTPHIGASTEEAQRFASTIACEEVLKVLRGEPPLNVVNMPRLSPDALNRLKHNINLAETLGTFAIQMVEGRIKDVEVVYCGTLAEEKHKDILTNAILKGLLNEILSESVNLLNAPVVAKNRDIRITEGKREDAGKYDNMIVLRVKTDLEETVLEGSSYGIETKIVSVNGYSVEVVPKGRMLVVHHEDKPGMIGRVSTLLGEQGINIGAMQVGRKEKSETQLMIIFVDHKVNKEVLEKISGIEGVKKVFSLNMGDGNESY